MKFEKHSHPRPPRNELFSAVHAPRLDKALYVVRMNRWTGLPPWSIVKQVKWLLHLRNGCTDMIRSIDRVMLTVSGDVLAQAKVEQTSEAFVSASRDAASAVAKLAKLAEVIEQLDQGS